MNITRAIINGDRIVTGVSSAAIPLPVDSAGRVPRLVRVAASQLAYVKLGMDRTVTATSNDTLVQAADPLLLLTSGCRWIAAIQGTQSGTVSVDVVEWGGNAEAPDLTLDFANMNEVLDSRITFTRASNATRFDRFGRMVWAPANMLVRSNAFDTTWTTATSVTVTGASGTAPDGTNTAWKLAEPALNQRHWVAQSVTVTAAGQFTFSVYAKAAERQYVGVVFGRASNPFTRGGAIFNLLNGAVTAIYSNNSPLLIERTVSTDVGGGWFRCSVSVIIDTSTSDGYVEVWPSSNGTSSTFLGTAGSGVLIWGAQLERTGLDSPISYIATTSAAYYGPRFDYDPATCQPLGLAMENARTNSIRNSAGLGAVVGNPGTNPNYWLISGWDNLAQQIVGTGVEDGIPYIDVRWVGTPTATNTTLFYPDGGTTQTAAASGETWTLSLYMRLLSGNLPASSIKFRLNERGSIGEDLLDTNWSSGMTLNVTRLREQRKTYTATLIAAGTNFVMGQVTVNGLSTSQQYDFTIRIAAPQLEKGEFASSHIPTGGIIVTRAGEVAKITGTPFTTYIGTAKGTLYGEYMVRGQDTTNIQTLAIIGSSTLPNSGVRIALNGGNFGGVVYDDTGSSQGPSNVTAFALIGAYKVVRLAVAFAANDGASSQNGSSPSTDTLITMPTTLDTFSIGCWPVSNGGQAHGWVKKITYDPRREPNAMVQAMTVV